MNEQILAAIRHLGGLLDDLEKVRIANGNRIAAMEREYGDAFGLDAIQAHLRATEHQAELELVRLWRKNELAAWAKSYHGLGEKSIARLIAAIGDPGGRPNPGKLFAYCGHGDPARSVRRKGITQAELLKAGNPRAKRQVRLISESFRKNRCAACTAYERSRREKPDTPAPWAPPPSDCTCFQDGCIGRVRYDDRRIETIEHVHERACPQCGPAGKPALPGSPWSMAHKDADALRIVGKKFLFDLWIASVQIPIEAQASNGGGSNTKGTA